MNSSAPTARGGRADLLGGRVRAAEGDVLADRAAEQERLLGHDPHLRAQRGAVTLAQVVPVDAARAPRGRVVEARDELGAGRLAGAGRADQRDRLARRDAQRHVVERGRAVAVGEGHAVEHDLAAQPRAARSRPARRPGRAPRRAARRSCPARPSPTGRSCRAGRAAGSGRRSCSARPGRRRARRS